jgi:hypothetical protein
MKKIMLLFGLIISNPFSGSKYDEIMAQSDVINSSIKHKNINWKNMIYGTLGIGGIGIIIAVIWRAFSRKSGNGKGGNDGSDNAMEELKNLNIEQKVKKLKLLRDDYQNKKGFDCLKISGLSNQVCRFYDLFSVAFTDNTIGIHDEDLKNKELEDKSFGIEETQEYENFKICANNILRIVKIETSNPNKTTSPYNWISLFFYDLNEQNQNRINDILDNLILAFTALNELKK